jgi:hypothetical protein
MAKDVKMTLKDRIRSTWNRIQRYFGYGYGPAPKRAPYRDLPRHEGRKDRSDQRKVWDFAQWKWYGEHNRPPMLRGKRLTRVQETCSPRHLTQLCRGARHTNAVKEWNEYADSVNSRTKVTLP